MTGTFNLNGQEFIALNAGPMFKFNEAISFVIDCQGQEEVDYYWDRLLEGGAAQQCGWLKDRFGLSWQIVPKALFAMLSSGDQKKTERVTKAFLQMKKFDIAALERAYAGA